MLKKQLLALVLLMIFVLGQAEAAVLVGIASKEANKFNEKFNTEEVVSTDNYYANELAVDAMFAQAEEVSQEMASFDMGNVLSGTTQVSGDKNPWVAFLLAFFIGNLGIHRLYLGTEILVVVGYIITCGGLGIVALIDWIVLLLGAVNNDVSKYENNSKFFMW